MAGVSFEDRVVVITGGAAGLGRTYALEIARRGGAVVLNDLGSTIEGYGDDRARTDAVVQDIVRANGRVAASPTGMLGDSMKPDFTTPMTVYLASEACQTTHSIYSSLGGRYARVFVGVTDGWQGSRETPSTVEDVAQHIETIRYPGRGWGIPTDPMNEYALLLKSNP